MVTWLTLLPAGPPTVQYGPLGTRPLPLTAEGHTSSYMTSDVIRYVHRVTLTGLTPDAKYGSSVCVCVCVFMYVYKYSSSSTS